LSYIRGITERRGYASDKGVAAADSRGCMVERSVSL